MPPSRRNQEPAFNFDPTLSAEDNIRAFLAHMKTKDQEMADILESNLSDLTPFPEEQQPRSQVRTEFNQKVKTELEKITTDTSS